MRTARLLDHWLPPEGVGAPVASLATTFTFDGTFFAEDCIARFLMLTGARGDQDEIADIALLLEEEEKLSEASVTVLADRSAATEQHNLRWDLIDVPVPGGLLHAKVAVMLWERATRVVIGSPNLTPAGYRNQVELALAIDLEGRCAVPRRLLDDLVQELRAFVDLAPGPADRPGPKTRAHATLDRLEERVAFDSQRRQALGVQRDGVDRYAVAPRHGRARDLRGQRRGRGIVGRRRAAEGEGVVRHLGSFRWSVVFARAPPRGKSAPRLDARPPTRVHVPMPAPTTLSELIALYLARCRIEGLSPRTQRAEARTASLVAAVATRDDGANHFTVVEEDRSRMTPLPRRE